MPVSTKTKAVAGLALLDIVRQVATAWSARERAREEAEQQRAVARFASGVRSKMPDWSEWELERGWPPIHRRSTAESRLRTWGPLALVIGAASAMIVVLAHVIVKREERAGMDADPADERAMVGAVRASARAIDAGVTKIAEGGTSAATGTAAAIAAGSSAVRTAAVARAKTELDERVIAPVRKKAVLYGVLGVLALTVYVALIATVVQLAVGAIA